MHVLSNEIIKKIANNPSVVVLTETTSNLHHQNFINTIEVVNKRKIINYKNTNTCSRIRHCFRAEKADNQQKEVA